MRKILKTKSKLLGSIAGSAVLLAALSSTPAIAGADEVDALKQQLDSMSQMMQELKDKIQKLESENVKKTDEIEEIDDRLNVAEMHTASDKISFGVDLRTKANSISYKDMLFAPSSLIQGFFTPVGMGGFNGATLAQIQAGMAMMPPMAPVESDHTNEIIYTNRLRLEMKGRVNEKLTFGGRLAAYKVWGDSTGVKFNQGSLGDVTFDGNTSSLPHGDTLRVERAFFSYKNAAGSLPISFSLGRRPSTEGPPLEYANYSSEGGSPLAPLINWQFDGASLNFGLEDVTGIPGAAFKFCYGVGFEGDWGNSSSLNNSQPDVSDVHLAGFIAHLFDNDNSSFVLNYAHASNITDGFTGLTVMPFIVSRADTNGDGTNEYFFDQNTGGFVSRIEPMTNIGDWDAATLLYRTNLSERLGDIDVFLSGSWSHTHPSQISKNPFYEIMGMGLLSSNGELKDRDGYAIHVGATFPMPHDARLGVEYNWGSQYWFNFTGAEDSLVASKMAARGQVYELYYIQPIFGQNFFVKFGGQYYDYDYTGSGNPLGAPVKISDTTALDTLNAVVDKVWTGYLSATMRF